MNRRRFLQAALLAAVVPKCLPSVGPVKWIFIEEGSECTNEMLRALVESWRAEYPEGKIPKRALATATSVPGGNLITIKEDFQWTALMTAEALLR